MNGLSAWWSAATRGWVLLLAVIGMVALWDVAISLFDVPSFLVPTPGAVIEVIRKNPEWLLKQTYYTLLATLAGFAAAVVIGVALAIAIVSSKLVEQTLYPVLVALNSIPKVAIAPLFIIWAGTGLGSKILMAAIIAIFAIVVDAIMGLRSVDPEVLDLAKSLGGDLARPDRHHCERVHRLEFRPGLRDYNGPEHIRYRPNFCGVAHSGGLGNRPLLRA
jgi:NitT/TauT family transport system permease protein